MCSNPEFLREGCALQDALHPDRIIIGADNPAAAQKLADIYSPLACPVIQTDLATAEIIKYASNAFLATKISLINAVADICELVGADVSVVAQGMGADPRIGHDYLQPGLGYGGSCLPKDVESFIAFAAAHGYEFKLLRAVRNVNDARIPRFVRRLERATGGLQGKTVGVLGLAFKPNTGDLRGSKAVELIQALLERGATVKAYDPVAMPECRKRLPQAQYADNPYELARGCHALVAATEWDEFKALNLGVIRDLMIEPVLFDGRSIYGPEKVCSLGFRYCGVGRGEPMRDTRLNGPATGSGAESRGTLILGHGGRS
jgi:UDPglucose 6-dehydrogenase